MAECVSTYLANGDTIVLYSITPSLVKYICTRWIRTYADVPNIVPYLSEQTSTCSLESVFADFQHVVTSPSDELHHFGTGPTTTTHLSLRDLISRSLAGFGTGRMAFQGRNGRARFTVTIQYPSTINNILQL